MAVNTQFAIAVHIMAGLGCQSGKDMHSCDLASSVNTSPSFVRRILAKLSKGGLIETATGKGGSCWISRDPKDVTLLQIYKAVDAPKAFAVHHYAVQKQCAVSQHIKTALNRVLDKTQASLEQSLGRITLADFIADLKLK